jgi:hypothetical protein
VVVDALQETKDRRDVKRRWPEGVAVGGAVLAGLLLGFLGWTLPTYGGSLVVPTMVVFGSGAVLVLVSWALASIRRQLRPLRVSSVIVGVFTIAASIWTFGFSLPASLAWDRGATQAAQLMLAQVGKTATHGVAPLQPCTDVTHGSIGSLQAPYSQCPEYTPEGHFVYRHLVGQWWMFVGDAASGSCPIGYQFHGGP